MASTYTDLDPAKPDGTSQTGTSAFVSSNKNDVALWYAVVMGSAKSFAFSIVIDTGTTEQPQYYVWTNGAIRVRSTNTWGVSAGGNGNITQQVWEVSQDTGTTPNATGTWASVCTQTYTYDATTAALTASTNAGGQTSWMMYLVGRAKAAIAGLVAHVALTGTSVHGLGSISTQGAATVAITGGAIDGTAVGATTPAGVTGAYFRGKCVNLGATITGSTAVDWTAGDHFYGTFTGAGATLTWSNLPPADRVQGITLEITNSVLATSPWPAGVKWPGGGTAPSRSSGVDLYEFFCRDGSTVRGAQAERQSA